MIYYEEYRACDNREIRGGLTKEPYEDTCKRKCDETNSCHFFYYMPSEDYCGLYSKCDRFRQVRGIANIFKSNDAGDIDIQLNRTIYLLAK